MWIAITAGVGAEKRRAEGESRKMGDGESVGREKDGKRAGDGDGDEKAVGIRHKLGGVVGDTKGDDGRNKQGDGIGNDGDGKGDKCEDCL